MCRECSNGIEKEQRRGKSVRRSNHAETRAQHQRHPEAARGRRTRAEGARQGRPGNHELRRLHDVRRFARPGVRRLDRSKPRAGSRHTGVRPDLRRPRHGCFGGGDLHFHLRSDQPEPDGREDDERSDLNLQISLLAEQEATQLLTLLREIAARLGVKVDGEEDIRELTKEITPEEVLNRLEDQKVRSGD